MTAPRPDAPPDRVPKNRADDARLEGLQLAAVRAWRAAFALDDAKTVREQRAEPAYLEQVREAYRVADRCEQEYRRAIVAVSSASSPEGATAREAEYAARLRELSDKDGSVTLTRDTAYAIADLLAALRETPEPVAWQYRYQSKYSDAWSSWIECANASERDAGVHYWRERGHVVETRDLYAAPSRSPAREGA